MSLHRNGRRRCIVCGTEFQRGEVRYDDQRYVGNYCSDHDKAPSDAA